MPENPSDAFKHNLPTGSGSRQPSGAFTDAHPARPAAPATGQYSRPARSSRATWRWVTFLLLAVAFAGAMFYARTTDRIDDSFRMFFTMLTVEATILLLALWFLIFGFSRWWVRLGIVVVGFGLLVGAIVYASNKLELRGVTGDWVPNFALKSTPKPDYALDPDPKPETPKVQPGPEREVPDFTRFLGSDGSNHLSVVNLDSDWENHPPKELWRRPVGAGWSAFAVAKERAVTQEQRGDFELVICYNLRDGALLWSHKDEVRFSEFQGGDGPRATPTIVGDKVFTMGATGILKCLNINTGEVVWAKNVLKDNQEESTQTGHVPMWGKSNSPLVYELKAGDRVRQFVVVSLGEDQQNSKAPATTLAAYDGQTGERIWTAGNDYGSYATPILAKLLGTEQVISVNGKSVTGHDPATGKVLWEHPWPNQWAKCSQPITVGEDKVFLSQGYMVGCQMIQVSKDGDHWSAQPLWAKKTMRTTFSNVVVHKDHVYGIDDGVLQCIDLHTGQSKWRQGRYRYGQVLGVDDLLIVQAEDGKVFLVAADPEQHRELGELDALHDKTWTNPVLVGKYLLLRNAGVAVCYELPLKGGK